MNIQIEYGIESIDSKRLERLFYRHVGPYAEEDPTINRLHSFAHDQNCLFDGLVQKHHEIYLSDMRRTAPKKFRTILKQPVIRK